MGGFRPVHSGTAAKGARLCNLASRFWTLSAKVRVHATSISSEEPGVLGAGYEHCRYCPVTSSKRTSSQTNSPLPLKIGV